MPGPPETPTVTVDPAATVIGVLLPFTVSVGPLECAAPEIRDKLATSATSEREVRSWMLRRFESSG